MSEPILREMRESDLPALFAIQDDPEAQRMAAFTDPRLDREGCLAEHRRHLADERMVRLVVELDEVVFRLD
ncbi:MAG: hypothetical protein HOV87_09080 [Catenulispora sp.]|nr:hypothetical protein [Catenulispora sp.]